MKSLMLDSNNNLVVSSELMIVEGIEALKQDINNRLKMIQGENIFNLKDGVPYFEVMQNNNIQNLKNIILQELKEDKRIRSIEVMDFKVNNNQNLNVELKITTKEGDVFYV